jgi:hypothetical protein
MRGQVPTRRRFLAALIGAPLVPCVREADDYRPCGHLDAQHPSEAEAAFMVSKVTLDGREIDHVFELDDVQGWLRRYVEDPDRDGPPRRVERIEYLTGVVRVYWRSAPGVGPLYRPPQSAVTIEPWADVDQAVTERLGEMLHASVEERLGL